MLKLNRCQHGILLGSLIDVLLKYEVAGSGLLFNPGHNNETLDEDFIELIKRINHKYELEYYYE